MDISIEPTGTALSIAIAGNMDADGCCSIRDQLEVLSMQHQCKIVILDLRQVAYIDSSGIGAIVFLFKRIHAAGGHFRLSGVSGQPRELMEQFNISRTIDIQFAEQQQAPLQPAQQLCTNRHSAGTLQAC